MKILLVDDIVDHCNYISNLLVRELQAEVETANSGEEALALLDLTEYDCVLLDYNLPTLNGLEVLHEIQKKGSLTSVVMVTGQGTEMVAVEAMKKGAYYYFTKSAISLNRAEVLELIKKAVAHTKTQTRLHRVENKLQTFFELSSELYFLLDEKNRITFITPRVQNLLEFTPDELTGQKFDAFIHPQDQGIWLRQVYQQRKNPSAIQCFNCRMVSKSNLTHEAQWLIKTVPDPDATLRTIAGSIKDVTEEKEKTQQLVDARTAAETKVKTLETLLRSASSYLQTELQALMPVDPASEPGSNQTAEQSSVNHQRPGLACSALAEQAGLLKLFIDSEIPQDHRDTAQLRTLAMQAAKASCQPISVLVVDDYELKGVNAPAFEVMLRCLMIQAERHVPATQPAEVVITGVPGPENSGLTCLSILNPTLNLSPDQVKVAFEPFSLAGLGTNFALAKHIAERHQGKIWIRSSTQGGTIFNLTFPSARVSQLKALG